LSLKVKRSRYAAVEVSWEKSVKVSEFRKGKEEKFSTKLDPRSLKATLEVWEKEEGEVSGGRKKRGRGRIWRQKNGLENGPREK